MGFCGKKSYRHQKVPGFMVADAVVVEPVSTAKFPANREKNREFFNFRRASRLIWPTSPMISVILSQIPYSTEQGIVFTEQGI
jgi:hypothetical protein